jgi:hypothetical protein
LSLMTDWCRDTDCVQMTLERTRNIKQLDRQTDPTDDDWIARQ